jgi:hypothetical protein
LEAFSESKPSLEDLKEIAAHLSRNYVSRNSLHVNRSRNIQRTGRDEQFENAIILNRYFLLYEEINYAMNAGDVGRVETCLRTWIFIFRATGKHKYAAHLTNYLIDVHYTFPMGLRKVIRYHILINPTGKPHHFRAVDWCVELNNLYTKVVHGGQGSNYTVAQIIKESSLIQIFWNMQRIIDENFGLMGRTYAHAGTDMQKTFQSVLAQLKTRKAHEKIPNGRKTKYTLADMIDKGRKDMDMGRVVNETESDLEDALRGETLNVEPDDILLEI